MRKTAIAQVLFDTFPLKGGLDLHTPQLELAPGVARDALNFECSITGGYTRIPGYERYDGRASPSSASYTVLTVTAVGTIVAGDAVNGQTSGATATVAMVSGLNVVVTQVAGTFVQGENLRKVAVVQGVINSAGALITDQVVAASYRLAAQNVYRNLIAVVPGSGPVRGVFQYKGNLYALRNNAGGTAAAMFRASAGGWVAITFGYELAFTAGSGTIPAEGSTITQGAVSAVVRRVVTQTGTWGAGPATGRFIIDAPAGGNFVAGALTAGGTATLSGVQTAITLSPGGRTEVAIGNAGLGIRVYAADGVNRGWEFDGSVFVPIKTGMASDTPLHVSVHQKYLFFSFGPSAQFSGVANPYSWTPLIGAGELAVDQDITGFLTLPGNSNTAALSVLTIDSVSVLYGIGPSGANPWSLVALPFGVGCKAYAAQSLNHAYIFDDLGVVSIEAVQQFGNFATSSLTQNIRRFVQQRKTLATESLINREKSQYRLYFSDGYALYLTIVNGQLIGAMPIQFKHVVNVACSGDSTNGGEVSYFGSTDGFVYRCDIGQSFDGQTIPFSVELAFASQGNARVLKRYRKAAFELQGDGYCEFKGGFTLAYGNVDVVQGDVPVPVSPVYWDQFTWDAFIWDGRAIAPSELYLEGTAENISLRIDGDSAYWPAFTVNSITLHYTPRRILR